jgi:hypothetical protein
VCCDLHMLDCILESVISYREAAGRWWGLGDNDYEVATSNLHVQAQCEGVVCHKLNLTLACVYTQRGTVRRAFSI